MSPSLAADPAGDPIEISRTDIIAAVLLHLAVLLAIVTLQAWQMRALPQPPPSVQVQIVSGQELRKLQQQARPKVQKAQKKEQKAGAKEQPLKPQPVPKPKAKPQSRAKAKPAFDPFKPLVSRRKAPRAQPARTALEATSAPASPKPKLSQAELDRYRALIQQAVQRHWKVPADIGGSVDPVVEMDLNSDGSIRRLMLVVSSGNAALDQSLLRAIKAAAPFVLPPQQFEAFRHNRIRFHPLR